MVLKLVTRLGVWARRICTRSLWPRARATWMGDEPWQLVIRGEAPACSRALVRGARPQEQERWRAVAPVSLEGWRWRRRMCRRKKRGEGNQAEK